MLIRVLDLETEQKLRSRLFSIHTSDPNWTSTTFYLVVSHRRTVQKSRERIILLAWGRTKQKM